ncbi:bifunctional DNA-formamidopyrimidine glycosylase/DNA-(apurinic or apyrimidinic site) lyase [Candidatus Curtissbacteria bacterium]|nr:bifunctional DNA-formamidopyrimidine glycosylase/DNA-(apurinic or apyrimidinic site) lyase [Candidatus Curtissbacteria bacterium]
MPELPEVTVIVNSLNKKLKGLELSGIEYDWPKKFFWGRFSIKDLRGKKVERVRRIGKVIVIEVSKGPKAKISHLRGVILEEIAVVIHLKLTGQLIYEDKQSRIAGGHPIPPLNLPVPNKTTRVTFSFTNGGPTSLKLRGASHLYFNDLRKFGWVKIVENKESEINEAIGAELGPDPLLMKFEDFRDRLKKRGQKKIKQLLMDQKFVAGVGNIYSDEGLWWAKVHPKRPALSLKDPEIKAIFEGVRKSMKLAIKKGGSSVNSFVGSGGEKGLYLSFAKAYHMTGKPCGRCKTAIVREKMGGRSAHYCPSCQKIS